MVWCENRSEKNTVAKYDRSIDSFDKMVDPYRSVSATTFISSFMRVHRMIIVVHLYISDVCVCVRVYDAIHLAKNEKKKHFHQNGI